MPRPVDDRSHLSQLHVADDHLRMAVYLISAQEDRLGRYRAAGLDTQFPEALLATMQAILRSFIGHRQMICDALELERSQTMSDIHTAP